jgi:hypothetical protein
VTHLLSRAVWGYQLRQTVAVARTQLGLKKHYPAICGRRPAMFSRTIFTLTANPS